MTKRAENLTVLVVGNSALTCKRGDDCAIGRGDSEALAVADSIRALRAGKTVSHEEGSAIIREAEDIWGAELKNSAGLGSLRRRKSRRSNRRKR